MKRVLYIIVIFVLFATSAMGQVEDNFNPIADFQRFRDSIHQDFEDFRRQANEEYANFMKEPWKPMTPKPALALPNKPKPSEPVVAPPVPQTETAPTQRTEAELIPIPVASVKPKPLETPQPQPMEPIPMKPRPNDPVIEFQFFDTPMAFHFSKTHALKLDDASENSVSSFWSQLSDPYYDNLIAECLDHRKRYNLCDWAYLLLTKQVAETLCEGANNESVVMHAYLLTQSGYQLRLGRSNEDKITILIGSNEKIYGYRFLNKEGLYYYVLDRSLDKLPLFLFDHAFPKERALSLSCTMPELNVFYTEERTVASKRYSEVKATVKTNKNLIDFFNMFPPCAEWHHYAKASLSEELKEGLYPVLRKAISGKSEWDAANILINFVQTAFSYQVDKEQFGYERPLFPDEIFYYPYSDCEDRSILFACLVHELIGLDVVFLDYPNHLATAVRFNDSYNGDYIEVDGQKYFISDPTYIGAAIGMCMPQYKQVQPIVQKIY